MAENKYRGKQLKRNQLEEVAVLGVGMTRFGELWNKSLLDLAVEASREALVDAGLSPVKIDAVVVGNMLSSQTDNQGHLGALVASRLGIRGAAIRVEGACASGGLAIRTGIEKLASGTAGKVLVVGAEKMTDYPVEMVAKLLMGAADEEEQIAGATFPGLYALVTRAYMEEYGVGVKEIAAVPVKNHAHGSLNPKAHLKFPITVEQVIGSPCVASPVKLLDCSPISDGAAAVVLSLTGGVKNGFVRITGSGQFSDLVGLAKRASLTSFPASREAARQAFDQSGLEPDDIDVMEVHDCFSIGEILALEDMGFAGRGEGYIKSGNGECRLGGKRPVNPSGGLKACGHPVAATGVKQIVELTLQLRKAAGLRQVDKARVGLAQNVGGVGGTAVVHILRKD